MFYGPRKFRVKFQRQIWSPSKSCR